MRYLLDTHYVLWALFDPKRIPKRVIDVFDDDSAAKAVSDVSMWEISVKFALGKLDLGNATPTTVLDTLDDTGFTILGLSSQLLASFYQLPAKPNHRDPFDRLLVWQSITEGYTFITHDANVAQYSGDGLQMLHA